MSKTDYITREKRLVEVGGKVIGWIEEDVFTKHVIGSKHKLLKPPAWAIDAEAFDREVKPNATEIVIVDKEADIEYHASAETFARHSFRFNRGFFDQYALPVRYWQPNSNERRQLSFWGGERNVQ